MRMARCELRMQEMIIAHMKFERREVRDRFHRVRGQVESVVREIQIEEIGMVFQDGVTPVRNFVRGKMNDGESAVGAGKIEACDSGGVSELEIVGEAVLGRNSKGR